MARKKPEPQPEPAAEPEVIYVATAPFNINGEGNNINHWVPGDVVEGEVLDFIQTWHPEWIRPLGPDEEVEEVEEEEVEEEELAEEAEEEFEEEGEEEFEEIDEEG
jgi:hypothetical protein